MQVSDLEGARLDYWVARAAGLPKPRIDDGLCWVEEPPCDGHPSGAVEAAFSPSTDWSEGGPIIERERIGVVGFDGCWGAQRRPGDRIAATPADIGHTGPTALLAAMRCYVGSRFGETVPDDAPSGD